MKFLQEFILADWQFFCVLRELIFSIRTDWFFLLGINFAIFREYPTSSIDNIFVFIEYVQQKYTFSINKPVFRCFRRVVIEQTYFLVLYFCVANLSQNIYSGGNFCRKNVCGNFYLQEHIIADHLKNRKNQNSQKFRATWYLMMKIHSVSQEIFQKRLLMLTLCLKCITMYTNFLIIASEVLKDRQKIFMIRHFQQHFRFGTLWKQEIFGSHWDIFGNPSHIKTKIPCI